MDDLSYHDRYKTIPDLRRYMAKHFPYVGLPENLKLKELQTLAKKWHNIAQESPMYKKRSFDSTIHDANESSGNSGATSSHTNPAQPASKKQKQTSESHMSPRPTKKKSVRFQNVAQVSKKASSARQTSKVNLKARICQKSQDRPRRNLARKQPVEYSSSLTALSDDEDRLSSLNNTRSPELPSPKSQYLSNSPLVDLGELEGLVFEPQQKPSITASNSANSTPHESSPANSNNPPELMNDEINLISLTDDDFFDYLYKDEVKLPVPPSSSEKRPCKCECQEEIALLKERIQKLEDLVFPPYRAVPPCCEAVLAELS